MRNFFSALLIMSTSWSVQAASPLIVESALSAKGEASTNFTQPSVIQDFTDFKWSVSKPSWFENPLQRLKGDLLLQIQSHGTLLSFALPKEGQYSYKEGDTFVMLMQATTPKSISIQVRFTSTVESVGTEEKEVECLYQKLAPKNAGLSNELAPFQLTPKIIVGKQISLVNTKKKTDLTSLILESTPGSEIVIDGKPEVKTIETVEKSLTECL
ncbi:MAG: hypothetical protein AAGB31_15565 [Bdellovibrio sp.]